MTWMKPYQIYELNLESLMSLKSVKFISCFPRSRLDQPLLVYHWLASFAYHRFSADFCHTHHTPSDMTDIEIKKRVQSKT